MGGEPVFEFKGGLGPQETREDSETAFPYIPLDGFLTRQPSESQNALYQLAHMGNSERHRRLPRSAVALILM